MAGANDASLFPANPKGARVLPFSAANGTPFAMLAGLADRLPSHYTVRFSPSDISPNSLHVARQPHSTGAVG